nr:unnamed protein product [Ananas comosus var. bracteatus]
MYGDPLNRLTFSLSFSEAKTPDSSEALLLHRFFRALVEEASRESGDRIAPRFRIPILIPILILILILLFVRGASPRDPKTGFFARKREMSKGRSPEPLDFFIWTVEDVGLWLEEINLGSYRQVFEENGVNGEYLESLSMFTTEQILRFIRRCHMKWGDFITLCKELRRIKVACLKGEQEVRRPWWAPPCLSVVFVRMAKRNRQSRVVSLKLEP